jgi:hypothetical protein
MRSPLPEPDDWTPKVLGNLTVEELEELVIKHQVDVIAANRQRVTKADLVQSLLAWKARLDAAGQPAVNPDAIVKSTKRHTRPSKTRPRSLTPWLTLASLLISTYITVWSVAVGEVRFTPDRLFPFPIFEWRFPSDCQDRIDAPPIQWSEDQIRRTVPLKADLRMQPKNGQDPLKNNLYYFVIDASKSANIPDFDTSANAPWVTDSLQLIKKFLDFPQPITTSVGAKSSGATPPESQEVDRLDEVLAQKNWQMLQTASAKAAERYQVQITSAVPSPQTNAKGSSKADTPEEPAPRSSVSRLQDGRIPYFHASLLATAAKLIQMESAANSSTRGYLRLDLLGGRLEPQLQNLSDQDAGRGGLYPSPLTVAGFTPITSHSIRKSVVLLLTAFDEKGEPTAWKDSDLNVTDFEKVWSAVGEIGDAMYPAAHSSDDSVPPPAPELHLVAFSDFDHSVELRHRRDNSNIRQSWINTENQFVTHCAGGSITLLAVAPEGVDLEARDDYPRAQRTLQKASVLLPREFFNRHTVEEFALATTRFNAPERVRPSAVFYYSGAGDVETHLETDLPAGGSLNIRWFMDSASRASGSYAFSYHSKDTNGLPVNAGHLYSERQIPLSFNSGSAAPTLRVRLESPVFQAPETLLISSDRLQKPLLLPVSCQQIISLSTSWVLLIIYSMIWLAANVIVSLLLLRRLHPRGIVGTVLGIVMASFISLGMACLIPLSIHQNWHPVLIACLAFMAVVSWLLWFHHAEDESPEHPTAPT